MRPCKKHPADFSSTIGVCASCLRDRLAVIMAAQTQLQLAQERSEHGYRHPSLVFPRSDAAACQLQSNHDQRFYSTPQVGRGGSVEAEMEKHGKKGNGGRIMSLFSGLFKWKREKSNFDGVQILNSSVTGPVGSLDPSSFSTSAASNPRRKNDKTCRRREYPNRDRGMSPVKENGHRGGASSGYSSESSQGWKQTPMRTTASTRNRGGERRTLKKKATGLTLYLSPLVRASPNRHWSPKSLPPEQGTAVGGEPRATPKHILPGASSFDKSRSRKLADFGKYHSHH